MYFTKLRKTLPQLEVMISVLTMEYGCKTDGEIALLMAKYFEVSVTDATEALEQYRALPVKQELSLKSRCYESI